jgi:hypothetical protein
MENDYENKQEKCQHGYDTNNCNTFIITVVIFFLNVRELGSCWLPCWCLFLVVTTYLDLEIFKVLNKFLKVEVKVE